MLVPVTEITAWLTTKHQGAWVLIRLDFDSITLALRRRRYYRLPEFRAADGVTDAYVTYCAFSEDHLLYHGYTNFDYAGITPDHHFGVVPLVPLEAPPVSFMETRRILSRHRYEPSTVFYLNKDTAVLVLGERSENPVSYFKVLDLPSMEFIAGIENIDDAALATALTPESWGATADGALVSMHRRTEAPGSLRAYQYTYDYRRLTLGQVRALSAWPEPTGSLELHTDNKALLQGSFMAVKALYGDRFDWGEASWASTYYYLPSGLTAIRSSINGGSPLASQYQLQADGSVLSDPVAPPLSLPVVDWVYELTLLPAISGSAPIGNVFGLGYDRRHGEAELFWTERVSTLEIA